MGWLLRWLATGDVVPLRRDTPVVLGRRDMERVSKTSKAPVDKRCSRQQVEVVWTTAITQEEDRVRCLVKGRNPSSLKHEGENDARILLPLTKQTNAGASASCDDGTALREGDVLCLLVGDEHYSLRLEQVIEEEEEEEKAKEPKTEAKEQRKDKEGEKEKEKEKEKEAEAVTSRKCDIYEEADRLAKKDEELALQLQRQCEKEEQERRARQEREDAALAKALAQQHNEDSIEAEEENERDPWKPLSSRKRERKELDDEEEEPTKKKKKKITTNITSTARSTGRGLGRRYAARKAMKLVSRIHWYDQVTAGSSSEEEEESAIDEEEEPENEFQPTSFRQRCMYGGECYRTNPNHRAEYSHPGDEDWEEGDDDSGEDVGSEDEKGPDEEESIDDDSDEYPG